jgi:hypothetical protein
LPKRGAYGACKIITLAYDNVLREVARSLYPQGIVEKERILQDDASNVVIPLWVWILSTIFGDAPSHPFKGSHTVLWAKRLPGKTQRQDRKCGEEASTDDEVVRVVKFEKQWLPRIEGTEVSPSSWLPEVHLGEIWPCSKKVEPVVIRYRYEGSHAGSTAVS